MQEIRSILQVVLLREESASRELGAALWATLQEVELLYNTAELRAKFDRVYVAKTRPEFLKEPFVLPQATVNAGWTQLWSKSGQRRTYDTETLYSRTRQLLGERGRSDALMIVTDQEITPPPRWRYMIWGGSGNEIVISVAPTDPRYWGIQAEDSVRVLTIKHRIRSACCSVVGVELGLERCQNPRCFLYSSVDSVTTLDEMVCLGPEHKLPKLSGLGFESVEESESESRNLLVNFAKKVGLVKSASAKDVQEPRALGKSFESEASA